VLNKKLKKLYIMAYLIFKTLDGKIYEKGFSRRSESKIKLFIDKLNSAGEKCNVYLIDNGSIKVYVTADYKKTRVYYDIDIDDPKRSKQLPDFVKAKYFELQNKEIIVDEIPKTEGLSLIPNIDINTLNFEIKYMTQKGKEITTPFTSIKNSITGNEIYFGIPVFESGLIFPVKEDDEFNDILDNAFFSIGNSLQEFLNLLSGEYIKLNIRGSSLAIKKSFGLIKNIYIRLVK
jgi:hypothetical protein